MLTKPQMQNFKSRFVTVAHTSTILIIKLAHINNSHNLCDQQQHKTYDDSGIFAHTPPSAHKNRVMLTHSNISCC